jgi:hypothetical protein
MASDWTDFDADKQATIMLSLNRSLYEHRAVG